MQRLLIVYNPRSSRFADVKREVINKAQHLKGYLIGKYGVEPTDVDRNAAKLAQIIKDGDLILSAGGDATGVISANAILLSGKDATLAVLPYGNFNDLACTLGTQTFEDVEEAIGSGFLKGFRSAAARDLAPAARGDGPAGCDPRKATPIAKLYPLEIYVDGKFFRYATCYVTIGMTAAAVKLYDSPVMRRKLRRFFGRTISSYTMLAGWYFRNRHRKQFIPTFRLNNKMQHTRTSDYTAVNGRFMARVMKGGTDFLKPKTFRSGTYRLTNFWRLIKFMVKSMFFRIPGTDTTRDIIEFSEPATVELQAEGEYHSFHGIKTIEIKKGSKALAVIQKTSR